jgi:hypothetical protein
MRWHVCRVHSYSHTAAGEEVFCRYLWDGNKRGRVLHPFGILVGPEDVYGVIWCSEGLHTLVALHPVIQTGCHAVDAQEWILDKDWGGPFAGLNRVV